MDWHTPGGPDELADLLEAAARSGRSVLVTGAPQAPDPPVPTGGTPPDLPVVSTAGMAGVREHRPRDLTVTVAAGTRTAELLERLEEAGTWVPLAGPALELSVGGAVACGLPGPFDAAYGDLRRQLLACSLATWDGRPARWGRGVMKNVAGYATTRAVAGSFGRLGVVHRVTLRLWPAPESRREARVVDADGAGALEAAGRMAVSDFDASVRPDAVVWRRGTDRERLVVGLVGRAASVDLRLERLRAWCRDAGLEVADVSRPPGPGRRAASRSDGPFGRGRHEGRSAAWASAGRTGFAEAARAAGRALGSSAGGSMEGYPLTGDLRVAWRAPGAGTPPEGGDGSAEPTERTGGRDDAGAADGGRPFTRLLDALEGTPVRLERGSRAALEAGTRRRAPGARRLEERVVEALDGRPRHWLSGYL